MKLHLKIVTLFILFLSLGCENNENASFEMANQPAADQTEQGEEINVERKLIKDGTVDFETVDISATRKLIFKSIEKYKGYLSEDRQYKSYGRINNTIIIRVPAESFDLLLADATEGVANFDNKYIAVKDVTEEFLDVEARLKTKKELEARYLELLKKANSVTEILEVEKQAGQLRSEIESIEGRLKYLENNVSLATLTMTFYQTVPHAAEYTNKFVDGFSNGWDNLIWFFVLLTNIWPFILIAIGLIFGIRRWRKRK